MSLRTKALLAIFAAAVLWGGAGTVGKILVREGNPFVVTFYRFGIASILLLPFFLKMHKPRGFLRDLIPLGMFNALNVILYYSGLTTTTANTAMIIGTATPTTTLVLSHFLTKDHITKENVIGILTGFTGALLVVLLPLFQKGDAVHGDFRGNILLVAGVICWSMYIVRSRVMVTQKNYSPLLATLMNFFVTTATSGLFALLSHQSFVLPALNKPYYAGTLAYASFGITIVTFFLFQWAVQHLSAATVSLKEYLQLIVAIGLNALILNEQLTVSYFVGATLVVIGVFVATGKRVSRKLASVLFSQGE